MTCGTIGTSLGTLPKYAHHDSNCTSQGDPFNIVVQGETSASVSKTLQGTQNADTGQNWKHPQKIIGLFATANDQWASVSGSCAPQVEQLVSGSFHSRFHIRMWDYNGNVIAGAHHENLLTLGGNAPYIHLHGVSSFESGKDSVCDDLRAAGKTVTQNAIWMDNYERERYCSGKAASII